jgi:hypothetical protein
MNAILSAPGTDLRNASNMRGAVTPMAANSNYPNPAKQPPIKLTDAEIGYKYIEFPDDVFFMESLAQNASFRDGKIAYIPVKRHVNGEEESHIYSISLDSDRAKHVAGPVTPMGVALPYSDPISVPMACCICALSIAILS